MAIPHFGFRGIAKSHGNNVVASASYMARQKMKDNQDGTTKKSYSTTKDHYLTMMMLPSGAPIEYEDPETCWNDLHALEKDREAVRFLLPCPKELTKEQSIELCKEWAYQEFVSKGLVVQLSFHLEKDDNDNFHCHGLGSYRQLIDGKWADVKSHKAYIDENGEIISKSKETPKLKNGKLQYDKQGNIKFTEGWQELVYDKDGKPLLNEDGTPVLKDIRTPRLNADGTQATSRNGYKKDGSINYKLEWKDRKIVNHDLEKRTASAEARMLWQDVQNKYYREHNIKDEHGNLLQVDLRSYAEQDKDKPEEQRRTPTRHQGIGPASEEIAEENRQEMQRRADVSEAEEIKQRISDNLKVITDYVENELKPEEVFVNEYAQPLTDVYAIKNEICEEAQGILIDGLQATNEDVRKLEQKPALSDREQARLDLFKARRSSWETVSTVNRRILNQNGTANLRIHFRNTWRGLNGWQRYSYVKGKGARQAEIYKIYLANKGQLDPSEKNPDLSLPRRFTANNALYSVIHGKFVPGIKSSYDADKSAKTNTRNVATAILGKWKKNATSATHMPPSQQDFEILTLMENVPERLRQLADGSRLTVVTTRPDNYNPEQDRQIYLARIQSIEQAEEQAKEEARKEAERLAEEAQRNAWSKEEYNRLSAIAKDDLEAYRVAVMQQVAIATYQERLDYYNQYMESEEKATAENAYKRWKDFEESERKAKIAHESKNSFWSLHEYTYHTDYDEIDRLERMYDRAKERLDAKYPDVPEEPDKQKIISDVKRRYGKMQANILIDSTKEIEFRDKDVLLAKYHTSADARNAYWQKKPKDDGDPNAGKKKTATRTQDADHDRKKPKGKSR